DLARPAGGVHRARRAQPARGRVPPARRPARRHRQVRHPPLRGGDAVVGRGPAPAAACVSVSGVGDGGGEGAVGARCVGDVSYERHEWRLQFPPSRWGWSQVCQMTAMQGFFRILALSVLLVGVLAASGCGSAESRRASHIARGQQYLADGKLEKARVEFGNALQIAPNDADARYLRGLVAERLGNVRAAAGLYHGAIDINPDHVKAIAGLAHMYVFGGLPDKALELVGPALAKHPDDPDLLTVRAAARAQLKDVQGGLADAERAVKLAPDNENAVALLAG